MYKKILIYGDKGVSRVGVDSLMRVVEKKLGYEALEIKADDILSKNCLDYAKALIIPGGMANEFQKKLEGIGNKKIKEYVENGGMYIGICGGAYYACSEIDFKGQNFNVKRKYELVFFEGKAKGSLSELTFDNRYYDETAYSKNFININLKINEKIDVFYYHGGPYFICDGKNNENYGIIGEFSDGKCGIIEGNIGKGSYFLSSVHFELQKESYKNIILDNLPKDISYNEKKRENWLYSQFNENYGNEIWKIIKNKL